MSRTCIVLMILVVAATNITSAIDEPPSGQSIKREVVKVRLVTLDVVAFDQEDRTVPGLLADDFELIVDGKRTTVDTFDVNCSLGGQERPKMGWTGRWSEPPDSDKEPRRIAFVFDYLHLPQVSTDDVYDVPMINPRYGIALMAHTVALRQLSRTLRQLPEANEEIMVAVLDGGLRIEQPFSSDRSRALETLARMEKDITLYAGFFEHVNEKPLFRGLSALVDLLDTVPGSKAAVIFTGGRGPDNKYDTEFHALANQAGLARVAFYPVDCAFHVTDREKPRGFLQGGG